MGILDKKNLLDKKELPDKKDILDAVKSYLSDHPADYGGHFENLLEFIYWYDSECNCEENETARKAYVEFWDKLCEACERIAGEAGTAGESREPEKSRASETDGNHAGKSEAIR